MTWLRFAPRHIHSTVSTYLIDRLDELEWTTSTPPLGATQLAIQTFRVPEAEATKVRSGTLAISMGDEQAPREEELGGPLCSQQFDLFVDVFQEKHAHAVSVATDVRDILMGRLPNCRRSLRVQDYSLDPPEDVSGWLLEFVNVIKLRLDSPTINWQQVQATLHVDYPEHIGEPDADALVSVATVGGGASL